MVAPSGEYQKRFRQGIHRVVEHHGPQLFRQRCPARFTGQRHAAASGFESVCQAADMGGLACAVDPLKADEQTRQEI